MTRPCLCIPSALQALAMLVERCERDVRACIHTLQFMAKRTKTISAKVRQGQVTVNCSGAELLKCSSADRTPSS